MVQIRVFDDFTKPIAIRVEAQEMRGYNYLFKEVVERKNLDSVLEELFRQYPEHEFYTFKL